MFVVYGERPELGPHRNLVEQGFDLGIGGCSVEDLANRGVQGLFARERVDGLHDLGELVDAEVPDGITGVFRCPTELGTGVVEECCHHPASLAFDLGRRKLTLFAGATPPDDKPHTNWLPAPTGEFSLYIRGYWAKEAVFDGTWTPPKITRIT